MYKVVAQLVLLYRSKRWVVKGDMLNLLEGFHHQEAQQITGMMEKHRAGGEWEYLLVVKSIESAGLYLIGVCIRRRKVVIAERVACRPIYELCKEVEQIPETSRLVQWCDQESVNKPK